MIRNLRHGLWLSIALAGLCCAVPRTRYYTIEMPRATQGGGAPFTRQIAVQRFRADHVLVDDRILYREGPNEVSFYEYSRWASPPVDIVTDYFISRLRNSGGSIRVSRYKERGPSDLTLQGRIYHFEEVDRGNEVLASVAVELELTDSTTRASVWRGQAECTRPVTTRDMAGVVNGISECLNETASKLLSEMEQQVRKAN